jgi:50S ribosomal protein L16 3-hydroxylase
MNSVRSPELAHDIDPNAPCALLGGMSISHFLAEYWHKKPLLIRQAMPQFTPPINKKALLDFATWDDVESRLIERKRNERKETRWHMQHGPFTAKQLPSAKQTQWTLLVQGANLLSDEVTQLLRQFRFIPDARLDDVMISYATDQGGVGPHVDSYDVFLLQAQGQRRWQISQQTDLTLQDDVPLKLLKHFDPTEEWVLSPGDMLYLPPSCAHDGVALGECMTYSIGFRAPTYRELLQGFFNFIHDQFDLLPDLDQRYSDADLTFSSDSSLVPIKMVDVMEDLLSQLQFDREQVTLFLGEYLSEPKATVFFDSPEPALTAELFQKRALQKGIELSLKTRVLFDGERWCFINGETWEITDAEKAILRHLTLHGYLNAHQIREQLEITLNETDRATVWAFLFELFERGWLELSIFQRH